MSKFYKTERIRKGFTLVEMLIVIFIIALLAALTLGISSSVLRNAEKNKTADVLKLMTMSLEEWELEKGRPMSFDGYIPVTDGIYDIQLGGIDGIVAPTFAEQGVTDSDMMDAMRLRMIAIVQVLQQSEAASGVLAKIIPEHFCKTSGIAPNELHTSDLCNVDGEHAPLVVDAWGTPIGVVFPGRNYADANQQTQQTQFALDQSGDQTVRDEAEDGLGSCLNERPYFVSAGPDRKWGYRSQSNSGNAGPGSRPAGSDPMWEDCIDNVYSYEPYIVETSR